MGAGIVNAAVRMLECAQDPRGDVGEAALWLAADDDETVDVPFWMERLDQLAAHLMASTAGRSGEEVIPECARLLRDELHLRGCGGANPSAHYLHSVLERGAGTPVSCGVVWMAVCRRAGIPVEGVALPGHFVVRIAGRLVDAFGGGEVLDVEGARSLVERVLGKELFALDPVWLGAASLSGILLQISRRLRGCYASMAEWDMALRCAERCVNLAPDSAVELRDRGIIYWQLGQRKNALSDLVWYLEMEPEAVDAEGVGRTIQKIRKQLS